MARDLTCLQGGWVGHCRPVTLGVSRGWAEEPRSQAVPPRWSHAAGWRCAEGSVGRGRVGGGVGEGQQGSTGLAGVSGASRDQRESAGQLVSVRVVGLSGCQWCQRGSVG